MAADQRARVREQVVTLHSLIVQADEVGRASAALMAEWMGGQGESGPVPAQRVDAHHTHACQRIERDLSTRRDEASTKLGNDVEKALAQLAEAAGRCPRGLVPWSDPLWHLNHVAEGGMSNR